MKRGIVALMVVFGFASPAQAAPGDPRLVQGVLEWPAKLTVEPFVVIRTDDGRWYYAEVKAAKRFESGPVSAGGRVTVLGTEAARPHEINAIAFRSGDAAAAASTPAPAKPAPEPPTAAVSAPAAPRVGESPTPAPPAAEKSMAVNEPEPAGDGPRWTELRGTVKVIAGNWIVVRTDKGQLVLVDLSTVRGGAASLRPGAAIALYGTPTEQKFQAMGIVPPDNRPAPRPATIPSRR